MNEQVERREIQRPFFGILDLSENLEGEKDTARLIRLLKENNLYKPDLLFAGVCNVDWEVIQRQGADSSERKSTFAYRETDCDENSAFPDWPYLYATAGGENPIILVYDGSKLSEEHPGALSFKFDKGFKPIDSLVAAFKLQE